MRVRENLSWKEDGVACQVVAQVGAGWVGWG